jgi:glycosyltransferase involved in cell wall biosynthesis
VNGSRPKTDVSVVILTFNEERNLPYALASVCDWARRVFVFDSFSTDRTLEIAREHGCVVWQHRFEDFSKQRNAALDMLPIDTEWVLFLDADEWLPAEFKDEVTRIVDSRPSENGFHCKRKLLWMGGWIRRGYYPVWILRLFRRGKGRCENRSVNEHLIVEGQTGVVQADFIHEDHNGVGRWVDKHNEYATREAHELRFGSRDGEVPGNVLGTQTERKRWLRTHVWERLPPLVRPFAYFGYRYVVRGGFLDGRAGLTYHVMQGLWFPLLIDLKVLESEGEPKRSRSESAVGGASEPGKP